MLMLAIEEDRGENKLINDEDMIKIVDALIQKIAESAPSEDELKLVGLDKQSINNIRKDYFVVEKNNFILEDNYSEGDYLKILYDKYKTHTLKIDIFFFLKELKEDNQYVYFAYFEIDEFVEDKFDKQIKKVNLYDECEDIVLVAKNIINFFEILIQISNYNKKGLLGQKYTSEERKKQRDICIKLAGGDDYADYFKSIYGFD